MRWDIEALKGAAGKAVERVNQHAGPYSYPDDVDLWFDFKTSEWVARVNDIIERHAASPVEAFNAIASGP